eukprot:CAMPEP_0116032682 /NCGR_PEP_ID=MMETSP0321-20121206/18326_1 /TAXON_ID=163516 /ORGANISM="Leptocylindrus danicus var. danicus, Strain B650" /LENGTH=168 /DNA_ID=CAMNT_0003508187 /DNA_START=28 /DNA_END=530 /DNA_ORIENTATION=-
MAPMATARSYFAAALKDKYIYVFGGYNNDYGGLSSTERYSIDNNTWEGLPDMPEWRSGHYAVSTTGSKIYIVGGVTCSVDVFETSSLSWMTSMYSRDMPEVRRCAAAVLLKKKYLVVIGGYGEGWHASCLIYDMWCNRWSSTPVSMDMMETRKDHTAAVLDGKIVVAG